LRENKAVEKAVAANFELGHLLMDAVQFLYQQHEYQ